MSIRVAIADDHSVIINGIKNMLADHPWITLTDTYANGEELLAGLEQTVPDVLLLDIRMPDKSGDKLVSVILKHHPTVRILALTNFDSVFLARKMLSHGALGYLLKSTDQDTLIRAIETVYEYQEFLEPELKQKLEERNIKDSRQASEFPALTPREKEVIQLIADGYTTQKITETLHLSEDTVDNYRSSLLAKFGVQNTAMLIKKAIYLGLVQ